MMYERHESFSGKEIRRYHKTAGAGFVDEAVWSQDLALQKPELCSGFLPVQWYKDVKLTDICQGAFGCYIDQNAARERYPYEEERQIPLVYRADLVSGGNYQIEVTIRAQEHVQEVLLFAGRRHLVYHGAMAAGEQRTVTSVVNICDIIPRGETVSFEDHSLDLALIGANVELVSIHIREWSGKTLYIAGDSTVTDQSAEYPYLPATSYNGWGQMIGYFLEGAAAVSNHAHSGLTTESFRSEGHYDIVLRNIKAHDYCLFQFAHNDQKLEHLKHDGGYRENLIRYIHEIREKDAFPIIVTPLARNTWKGNDGTYNDLLVDYAAECIKIGAQFHVPVLDLHGKSMAFIIERGLEAAKPYFFPGDYTHSNDHGGYVFASFVADELHNMDGMYEDDYGVLKNASGHKGAFNPPQRIRKAQAPASYAGAEPGVEAVLERPDDHMTRAEALQMVIKKVNFFPTNVYNDMFTDVVGHEWFAGTVECAYQNGMILDEMVEDGKFYPNREVTGEEFIAILMMAYRSRKEWPKEVQTLQGISHWANPAVSAALTLTLISDVHGLTEPLTRKQAAKICSRVQL